MEDLVIISGIVSPYEWDDQGHPLKVKVCCPNEQDYFVMDNEMGRRLFPMLRSWVTIRGALLRFNQMQVIDVKEINTDNKGE